MKEVYRIKGKQRWNMTDETTGDQIKGAKIFLSDGEILNTPDKVGEFDTSFSVPYETFEQITVVPGDYEIDFAMKVGSKSQFTVSGVTYVGDEIKQK